MDTLLRASIVHTTEGADISLQYSIQSTVLRCGLLPRYYALFLFEYNVWLDYVYPPPRSVQLPVMKCRPWVSLFSVSAGRFLQPGSISGSTEFAPCIVPCLSNVLQTKPGMRVARLVACFSCFSFDFFHTSNPVGSGTRASLWDERPRYNGGENCRCTVKSLSE